jgi:DNA primase
LIVVEGFFECLKVPQAGFLCVALMGWSLSEEQELLLAKHFQRVRLVTDADPAGQEGRLTA